MEIKPQIATGEYRIQQREFGEGELIRRDGAAGEGGGITEQSDAADIQFVPAKDTSPDSASQAPGESRLMMGLTSSSAILNATASAMSSPSLSMPLEEALKKLSAKNVEFFRTRGFFIPVIMKKTVTIHPAEMAKIMTQGSEKARAGLSAVVDGETTVKPFTENDARELLAFKKLDTTSCTPSPDLASLLQKASKDGITIEGEGDIKGAFGAYRHLVSQGSDGPVRLSRRGAELAVVTKADLADIPALEAKLNKMDSVLSSLKGSLDLFNLAASPVDGTTLEERAQAMQKMLAHSRGDKYDDSVASVQKDWQILREKSRDGRELISLARLYTDMLDANDGSHWGADYREGLELILGRFKDHPDEAAAFNGLLKRGINISTAAKIFNTMPQPVKPGDFDKAAALFHNDSNAYFYWSPEKVDLVMAPRGDSTLADRIDTTMRLYRHCKDSDSTEKGWKNVKDEIENLTVLTKDGSFAKTGRMYADMLDASNSSRWQSSYREGLELIVGRFKDHPDEMAAFNELLKRSISIPTAAKIFNTLPQPVKPGDFEEAAELFHNDTNTYFYWSPEKVELVMAPRGDSTLADRIDLAMRLHRRCKDSDSTEKGWKNVKDEIENLTALTKDGGFTKAGRLYADMLDANNSSRWQSGYREGLELILGRFKDHPDEMAAFNDLLRRSIDIPTAAKIFNTLPQPVKPGDFDKAAALFHNDTNTYFYWSPEKVEFVMAPRGDSTLADRIDMSMKLHRHCKDSDSTEKGWKNVKAEIDNLTEISKGGSFTGAAKLFTGMLDAASKTYWSGDYRQGLELIVSRFNDHPEEAEVFNDLLRRSIDIPTAAKIFNTLPQPVKPGDFDKAAALFHNDTNNYFYWDPEKVEFVMAPRGDSTLTDRIDMAMKLHRHCKDSDSTEKGWKNVKLEIGNLTEISKDGSLTGAAKLYTGMLDAKNSTYWRGEYRQGLELIESRFKDHPDEMTTFNDLLKRGIDIPTAAKIFNTLPQPVKPGEFEKTAALFQNDANTGLYWDPEMVELAAAPIPGTTLRDRTELMHSLARHDRSNESSDKSWKNTKGVFAALKEASGNDFLHYADLYVKSLTMASRTYRDESHEVTLGLITGDLAKDAEHWKIYQELLEQGKYLLYANEAYSATLAPVQGEDLAVRKEAVKKLMGPDFSEFYKIACRNIPAGETVLDSASILGALGKIHGEHSAKECEALFKKIVQAKGSLTGSSVADLVRYVDFNRPEMLTGLIEDLNSLKASESFEGRRDVFVSFFKKHFNENTRNLDEARKAFSSIHRRLGEKDSIAEAAGRFDKLNEYVKSCDEARKANPLTLTGDCMDFIESNLKSGNLGECTRDELYADFESILLLSKKVDDAKFQLLHQHQPSQDSTIEHGDDSVIIGGVKLDIKKTWSNP
jgi:hypothetical protein